jgi:hypothetical protein
VELFHLQKSGSELFIFHYILHAYTIYHPAKPCNPCSFQAFHTKSGGNGEKFTITAGVLSKASTNFQKIHVFGNFLLSP